MNDKVTRHSFPQLRIAGFALAGPSVDPRGRPRGWWWCQDLRGWPVLVAAAVGFAGIFFALERKAVEARFGDLDQPSKKLALELAWQPLRLPDLSPWKWGVGATLGGAVGFALGVFAELGPVVFVAALIPAGTAFVRGRFLANPFWERHGLRVAGVGYVRAMKQPWILAGGKQEGERTLARFRMTDASKTWFLFWFPVVSEPGPTDMPPRVFEYHVLAVGEVLGTRSGAFIDLRATSFRHAAEADPEVAVENLVSVGQDSSKVEEREAHYKDVVTVDYKRAPNTGGPSLARGVFQVGLTNGQTMSFATEEEGTRVEAALENIRDRTRRAKTA